VEISSWTLFSCRIKLLGQVMDTLEKILIYIHVAMSLWQSLCLVFLIKSDP
jgi:hypothetical protein